MTPDQFFWQAEFQSQSAHFVLEQVPQWFDELESQLLRQPAHVVVQFDRGGRAVRCCTAFNHVRIQRALGQEFDLRYPLCFLSEAIDEGLSDDLAFCLWLGRSRQFGQETVLRLDNVQVGLEVICKLLNDRLLFVFSQQAVVNENT